MKLKIIFGLILIMSASAIFAKPSKMLEKNMKDIVSNHPLFILKYSSAGCAYKFKVNDVPIESAPNGAVADSYTPINDLLKTGVNTISMQINVLSEKSVKQLVQMGQMCEPKIALMVNRENGKLGDSIDIANIVYKSAANKILPKEIFYKASSAIGKYDSRNYFKDDGRGDTEVGRIQATSSEVNGKAILTLKREIILPKLPFPKWAWFGADKIANDEKTKSDLVTLYKKIWTALREKKVDSIADLFNLRTKEYADAVYKDKKAFDMVQELKRLANDNHRELGGFDPKYEHLEVFGNNRLAKLTLWDGSPAIFFNDKAENGGSKSFDIIFAKIKGKWVIVR